MKFFLDTANIQEIERAADLGLLDGVTTNPSLMAKEVERTGEKPEAILKTICDIVKGPVNGEVIALDAEGMVEEGRKLAAIDEHIVVKIPMTAEGLKAVRILSDESIHTNVTLIFSPLQALLAAKAGASYVSPFVGRLDDIGHDGMDLVDQILQIFENYWLDTEVIVASVRGPMHVLDASLLGAHIATVPFKVIEQIQKHPLTDLGIERFLADWKKISG